MEKSLYEKRSQKESEEVMMEIIPEE